MTAWLKRHPVAIKAILQRTLVLTYSYPAEVLQTLLPPGLMLDTFKEKGFVAIALVQTHALRPYFLPGWLGLDFFLAGFRIFTRFPHAGRTWRGLRILRSYADKHAMVFFGNLLTHYNYRHAQVYSRDGDETWLIRLQTPFEESDLEVEVFRNKAELPPDSPFSTLREALRFAGPLPFTFDYEKETHSIIRIEGVRQNWKPSLVKVNVKRNHFFSTPPLNRSEPLLASAFLIEQTPYMWKKGIRHRI